MISPLWAAKARPVRLMGQREQRAAGLFAGRALPAALLGRDDVAHGFDEAVMVEALRRPLGDDAAVLHDDDAVGGCEDLAQDMRDEDDRRRPSATKRRT